MQAMHYIVDTDVLITAKNRYYSFDICPGFWKSIIHFNGQGQIASIDSVRKELLISNRKDPLVEWIHTDLPDDFFLDTESDDVVSTYTEIMLWAQRHPRYYDYAKAKFASGADGWLVAYARVNGVTVVTNEQPSPGSHKDIKLPDVCDEFQVARTDTFQMLKDLGIRFDWSPRV